MLNLCNKHMWTSFGVSEPQVLFKNGDNTPGSYIPPQPRIAFYASFAGIVAALHRLQSYKKPYTILDEATTRILNTLKPCFDSLYDGSYQYTDRDQLKRDITKRSRECQKTVEELADEMDKLKQWEDTKYPQRVLLVLDGERPSKYKIRNLIKKFHNGVYYLSSELDNFGIDPNSIIILRYDRQGRDTYMVGNHVLNTHHGNHQLSSTTSNRNTKMATATTGTERKTIQYESDQSYSRVMPETWVDYLPQAVPRARVDQSLSPVMPGTWVD
ncbi:hypothetical protein FPQ18DRAFT_406805 [Pyronema domesticum]|nr:hypothetical protein FPQ18DRAFT_406805 [Pyronema domesticum]